MLTESEKRWLEDRWHTPYCRYCNVSKLCANPFASGYSCPLTGNMKDAAEFSERVAARLATNQNCGVDEDCPPNMAFGWGRLKAARLAVEEEMDANGK